MGSFGCYKRKDGTDRSPEDPDFSDNRQIDR